MARRTPTLSLTIVLTLALGIGLASAIFTFADGYLFRPLPMSDADRLFYVQLQGEGGPWLRSHEIEALRESDIGNLGFVETTKSPLVVPGSLLDVDGREVRIWVDGVSKGFGSVVQVRLRLGRQFADDEYRGTEPVPVLLAHRFWLREFGGDPAALGRRFTARSAGNATAIVVVGVLDSRVTTLDPEFGPSRILPDMIAPARPEEPNPNTMGRPVVRLPESMTRARAEVAIGAALQSISPGPAGETRRVALVSIRELQTSAGRPLATAFFIGALLALALVTVNVALLLLTSVESRSQEMATRAALGASAWRMARPFLVESLIFGVTGIAGGLVLGRWLAVSLASEIPTLGSEAANLAFVAMNFDARVYAFAGTMGAIVALVLGAWPAWRATRATSLIADRPHTSGRGSPGRRFSKVVLAAEVAMSMVVLAGTVFAGIGIWRYVNQPLGFELQDRIGVNFTRRPGATDSAADWPAILKAVRSVPGVRAAAVYPPELVRGALYAGERELGSDTARAVSVDADYFEAWGVDLLAGRMPDPAEVTAGAPVLVVDERFAELVWPGLDPVGMAVRGGDGLLRSVVGVVTHQRERLSAEGAGIGYIVKPGFDRVRRVVVWAPGLTDADLTRHLDAVLGRLAPGLMPVVYEITFDYWYQADLAEVHLQQPILMTLGLFTLSVVGVGLFGLVAFLVERRSREFGIRLALGAQSSDVWREVVWQGAAPACAGIAVGATASWLLQRIVQATMFGWESSGPTAIVSVGALLLSVAVLAAIGPVRRILRSQPTAVLRAE